MTDYDRGDLVKVQFHFAQTGTLSVTVEIEPQDGETPEQTINRARDAVYEEGYEWPAQLCIQCGGGESTTAHKSAGGDGVYTLELDENYGDETGAEVLTGDDD